MDVFGLLRKQYLNYIKNSVDHNLLVDGHKSQWSISMLRHSGMEFLTTFNPLRTIRFVRHELRKLRIVQDVRKEGLFEGKIHVASDDQNVVTIMNFSERQYGGYIFSEQGAYFDGFYKLTPIKANQDVKRFRKVVAILNKHLPNVDYKVSNKSKSELSVLEKNFKAARKVVTQFRNNEVGADKVLEKIGDLESELKNAFKHDPVLAFKAARYSFNKRAGLQQSVSDDLLKTILKNLDAIKAADYESALVAARFVLKNAKGDALSALRKEARNALGENSPTKRKPKIAPETSKFKVSQETHPKRSADEFIPHWVVPAVGLGS